MSKLWRQIEFPNIRMRCQFEIGCEIEIRTLFHALYKMQSLIKLLTNRTVNCKTEPPQIVWKYAG